MQQVQLYYAGNSRYIGLFDTPQEASIAYETARKIRGLFAEDDPTPVQIKRNLDSMRKAAFSAVAPEAEEDDTSFTHDANLWMRSNAELPMPDRLYDKEVGELRPKKIRDTSCGKPAKAMKANVREIKKAVKTNKISKVAKAAENRPSNRTQNKVDEKPKKLKVLHKVASDKSQTNKPKASKLQNVQAVSDEAESRKRKFSTDIYHKAKALAESLPRGITVRPSGKWVSNSCRFS